MLGGASGLRPVRPVEAIHGRGSALADQARDRVGCGTHRLLHHEHVLRDWIAGSRLHVLDIVIVRGLTFLPVYLLGFSQPAVYAYLLFVSFHGVFLHANVGLRLGALEHVLALPRFHHWHHSSETEALDKNFALHFPWIDQIFGTKHLPDGRWPARYGVVGYTLPEGWWPQLLWPLRKAQKPLSRSP